MKKYIVILLSIIFLILFFRYYGRYLFRRRIVKIAQKEYDKFGNGTIKESSSSVKPYIAAYWQEGLNMSPQSPTGVPWSAAFISYVMRKAGSKNKFNYSQRHSTYIRWAINNLRINDGYFKAYQPATLPIEKGDLVCYARQSGVNYDTGTDYDSHCDIITEVNKEKGTATGIGGNVSNSVSKTTYSIDKNGHITTAKIFAIIKPTVNAFA